KSKAKSKPTAKPAAVLSKRDAMVAGITISNSSKLFWPETDEAPAITKLELAQYYEKAASRILPHIAGRPLSMVRAPEGIGGQRFSHRHVLAGAEKYLTPIRISGRKEVYVSIDSEEGLVALAQAAVLELHPWGSKPGSPEVPDRLIFDLDPAPDVDFDTVIGA